MGRIIAFFVMIMLVAQWGNAQDSVAVAEKFKQSGEEISEPINLTDGNDKYTVYFYMKGGEIIGAVVFKNEELVKDDTTYIKIVDYALQYKENDFKNLLLTLQGLSDKKSRMLNALSDLANDIKEFTKPNEKVKIKLNFDDLLEEYSKRITEAKNSMKQYEENWLFLYQSSLKGLSEKNIQSLTDLMMNRENILDSFDGLENAHKEFYKHYLEADQIGCDMLSRKLKTELEALLPFEISITSEPKEDIEKSKKEMENLKSTLEDLRKKIGLLKTFEQKSDELAVDFFEKRVPPKLIIDITFPTQETQGNPVSVSVKIRNEGMTEARNVKLSVILDITQKSESIEKLQAGEEKELQYTFETNEMKSGAKTFAVNIAYEGIRGTFSLSEEKEMLLKYNYTPIVIGCGIIVVLLVAGILVIRMKKKTVEIEQPIESPPESAESPPSEP